MTPPRRPVIEGKVRSLHARAGVQNATVNLVDKRGASRRTVFTDGEGAFVFYDVPPGQYEISVSHADYEPGSSIVDFSGDQELGISITLVEKGHGTLVGPPQPVPVWALQIPEKARVEYNKGLEAFRKGEGKRSMVNFEAAINLYPQYAAAYSALGAASMETGSKDAAEKAYQSALKIDPNLPDACLGLGVLYLSQKSYAEAERLLLRARQLKPEEWRIHHQLGEVYWAAGDWAKAEESLREARALHAESPRVHLLLINVLALQEKYPEALAAMEEFLRRFPENSFAAQVRQKRDALKTHLEKTTAVHAEKRP